MDTSDLVSAALTGRREAVESLVSQVWPRAFAIAYPVLRDRRLAEDAAQEACAILYLRITRLRSAQAFNVWFYRIVLREAMRLDRRQNQDEPCRVALTDFETIENVEGRLDLLKALGRLTGVQRAALVLHYVGGLTSREIGETLQIPDSSVRFHALQAKRLLAGWLPDHGATSKGLLRVI